LADRKKDFLGEVRFMFQPGEEGYHGARFMMDDGLLDPLPEAAFALHIMPNAPHGTIAGRAGPLMAAADKFEITVTGKGGHASMPHDTLDPVPVAAEIITALQSMVTRRFNATEAVVLTVTEIQAGSAHNVIADRAILRGTMRSLSAANRHQLHALATQLAEGIASAHGMSCAVLISPGFPVTLCDARAVELGKTEAQFLFGKESWLTLPEPIMGAEDFSYVLEKVPGAMFFLGVAKQGDDWANCCGIHNAGMMVDESVLPRGSAILAGCALRFLADGFEQSV
ncbi:MAG: M20 family metallopeptidase, partial [Sphingomonadaceae bacterium]